MLIYKELREHLDDRMDFQHSSESIPGDSERLGRVLLKLPLLAQLNTSMIEETFFVGLIGKGRFDPWLTFCQRQSIRSFSLRFSTNSENHSLYFEITRPIFVFAADQM